MLVPVEFLFFGAIILCAYFSYRAGQRYGMETAVDATLKALENLGYIRTVEDENGNIEVLPVQSDKKV
jgi:hypothetical protein